MKTPFSFFIVLFFLLPAFISAQSPDLGDASPFALFTSSGAFNNNGNTVVTGDIGTNVGAFSGFPPGIVIGQIHVADLISSLTAPDVDDAYSYLASLTCGSVLGTTLGGGQMLLPNIYCMGAASVINGTLVLDAQGDPDAIFVFQIDGALSTGVLANVTLINSASICNVFWQVNGEFSLGDGSVFRGTLLNTGAIHLLEASSLYGRALSRAGAIDLHNNVVSIGLPPIASVITASGPTTFCQGGSVTLSGNVSGTWNTMSGASSIIVNSSGNYFVVNTTLCGNDTSNHIIVNVIPDLPPSISCPVNITIQCNQSTLPALTGTATTSDNCGAAPSLAYNDVTAQGICQQAYTINRTWISTDASGNTNSCTQSISIVDNTAPIISCPPNITIQCSASTIAANTGTATAVDNCSGNTFITSTDIVNFSPVCQQSYTIIRRWQATDNCGNNNTCNQIINIIDNTPPSISCPPNITIACEGNTLPANTGIATGLDNCDPSLSASYSDVLIPAAGCSSIIRTWTLADDCGNQSSCTQSITVTNGTSISISCPGSISVACSVLVPASNPALVNASSTCQGPITISSGNDVISNQTCANRFNITRTYTASDACGNIASCTQVITVFDNTPPAITCPGNITVQCAGLIPAANISTVTAVDNCGGNPTVNFISDVVTSQTCTNRFTITRTYRSTDACGNSQNCNQTITVLDNTPPTITCTPNITVQCSNLIPGANPVAVVSADNCGGLATVTFLSDVISNLSCVNRFTVTRTYRSTDACGNFADCNQIITVSDNTPPVIVCPLNITVQCTSQVPVAIPSNITSIDNCNGSSTVTFVGDVISNFVCANQYFINRTFMATDECANTSVCVQLIRVFDASSVSIVCPPNITVACASQVPAVNLNVLVTSMACGGTTSVSLLSEVISGQSCTNHYTLTRTYMATGACAQSQTCVQIITVADNLPPIITLPQGLVNGSTLNVQCFGQDPEWDLPVFNQNSITTNDNCNSSVNVAFTQVLMDEGVCSEDGYINLYRLTWTATDACGNSSSANIFMALIDTIAPIIHGVPADITVQCGQVPEQNSEIYASDECLCACVLSVNQSLPITGCMDGQVMTKTWTAKDRCGNIATGIQRITFINVSEPEIHFQMSSMIGINVDSTLNFTCAGGGIPTAINTLNAASVIGTSGCGGAVTITFDQKIITARNCDVNGFLEQRIYHWKGVDQCGNEVNRTITATLTDYQAPVLIGVPMLACISDPILKDIQATDDCSESHIRFWDVQTPNPCGAGFAVRRTYEAYDDCGNFSRDTAILIPNEETPPTLTFVNPDLLSLSLGEVIVLNCSAHDEQISPFGFTDVVSNHACEGMTEISYAEQLIESGDCSTGANVALMKLTWTATDVCGNMTDLSVTASIEDKSNPVFVNLNSVVSIGCNDSLPDVHATDNCGSVTITINNRYFYTDCPTKYSVEREITATDPCGNETVGFQTVLIGGGGPVIKGVEEKVCDNLAIPVITAFDACADKFVPVTMLEDTLEERCQGFVLQRVWSAISQCGDTSRITQLVVIGDTIAPIILIPSYSVVYQFLDAVQNEVFLSQTELIRKLEELNMNSVSVSDNCEPGIEPVFSKWTLPMDCMLSGFLQQTTYSWISTDACGNSSSLSFVVDVIDDIPPVNLNVPGDTLVVCTTLPAPPTVNAKDNDQSVPVIYTQTIMPGNATGKFLVTRTWVSTDNCGNTTISTQHITWIPDSFLSCSIILPEAIDCNSHGVSITSEVSGGIGTDTYVWEIVGSKCFIQAGQGTPAISIYMGWEDVKIILTITDQYGCQSMCMRTLHCLEPGEIPMIYNLGVIKPDEDHSGLLSPAESHRNREAFLKDLNIWPNPAKISLNISFESSTTNFIELSFINFLGQVKHTEKMEIQKGLNTRGMDIGSLPGGTYLMEIKSDKSIETKVVVIMP